MSRSINFNGATLFKPGAFSKTVVNLSGGFAASPTGIVAIIGEAEGGESGTGGVQKFTSEDISSLVEIFKSGPIVDAARILVAPALDNKVPNGASQIFVYKTNPSTKSTTKLSNSVIDLLNISSANFGEDENTISIEVIAGVDTAARIIKLKKGTKSEQLSVNANDDIISMQYTGSEVSADLTIQSGSLAVSAGADSIAITLAGKTVQQVVDLISAEADYTATTAIFNASSKSSSDLDPISTATDVKTASVDLKAGQKEILDIINSESQLISATSVANVEGQIEVSAKKFLKNGSKGASTNTLFQAAFDALLAERVNIVVPLVSRDATSLITAGKTDAASTFTINAINLQAVTHCITASNTKSRSERNCYTSIKDTLVNSQTAARNLGHERATMLFQDTDILGADGNIKTEDSWAASCMVAGIQAGTDVGTPATFKRIKANAISHTDYNSKTQIDLAISAGLCPLEELDSGGFRVVVHNSTYNADDNFVFNRPSVLEAADFVAYNLRKSLEAQFVGNKASTGIATAIKNAVIVDMSNFLGSDVIVGDDTNNGLGYKDLIVLVTGNKATVKITITPVQGIDFVLAEITLDDIRQTAS